MTELNLEALQVALQVALRPIHRGLDELSSRVDGLLTGVDGLRTRVDGLASEVANVRIRVDGLPLLGVAVETLRQDVRMTRAAINDMARVNITAGEVEAMHTDIDRTMARQDEIERRLVTLERLTEQRPHGA